MGLKANIEIKPLSINRAWKGRRFRTYEYKKYEEEMLYLLPKKEMVKGKVGVLLAFYIKNPKQCDVDNFIKPVLDIIVKKGYIEDDRYVYMVQALKIKSCKNTMMVKIAKIQTKVV